MIKRNEIQEHKLPTANEIQEHKLPTANVTNVLHIMSAVKSTCKVVTNLTNIRSKPNSFLYRNNEILLYNLPATTETLLQHNVRRIMHHSGPLDKLIIP